MHSAIVRAQNVFGFFTTVAFSVAALVAFSVLIFPQQPSADITLKSVQVVKGRPHYYSTKKEEYAIIRFNLDADLSSLFNWNTKQIFVWATAKWPADKANVAPNEAVIWDQIITADPSQNPNLPTGRRKSNTTPLPKSERGVIKLRNQKAKYQITDMIGNIAHKTNATLELSWNVQPWVGALTWTTHKPWGNWHALKGGKSKMFDFPDLKVKKDAGAGSSNNKAKS